MEAWNDFVVTLRAAGVERLPGFPVWMDAFIHEDDLIIEDGTPSGRRTSCARTRPSTRSTRNCSRSGLGAGTTSRDFPASRRKFEWQAQEPRSLDETVMHLRPSGLRAKRATYVPALVAITQTSILGDQRRRLSPREAARLQGLPEWFDFGDQPDAATYKQMGNGVNVGAAYHVFREHVLAGASGSS